MKGTWGAVLTGSALLLSLGLPSSAHAVTLARYELHVTPHPTDGGPAVYRLVLAYRTLMLRKGDGFKFLGTEPISDLRASDPSGAPLPVREMGQYREVRIEFDLPPKGEDGLQTAIIDFRQALDERTYGWRGATYAIDWAHRFKIGIDRMDVHAYVPFNRTLEGYECEPSEEGTRCSRTARGAFPVTLALTSSGTLGRNVLLAAIVVLAFVLALGWFMRKVFEQWVDLFGVVPPASPVAYPDMPRTYREPAALPVAQELKATLPLEDGRRLFLRFAFLGVVSLGSLAALAVGMDGTSPVPLPLLLLGAAVLLSGVAYLYLTAVKGRHWVIFSTVFALGGVALGGALAYALAGLLPIVFVPMFWAGGGGRGGSGTGTLGYVAGCGGGGCGGGGCGGGGCGGCGG